MFLGARAICNVIPRLIHTYVPPQLRVLGGRREEHTRDNPMLLHPDDLPTFPHAHVSSHFYPLNQHYHYFASVS